MAGWDLLIIANYSLGTAPVDYRPSATEVTLCRKLAQTKHELLPPAFLPSSSSLLSLLVVGAFGSSSFSALSTMVHVMGRLFA